MTRREELEHRAATYCRECLASFETAEKKLHPMGSPVSRAPREELDEDSDDDSSESSEPERPMAKAAPKPKAKVKAAPKPLTGWCALQAAIKQGDYSPKLMCRRLTSSREALRFSASALTAAFSTGLSCSRRSRTWVAILNFSTEQKKAAASEEITVGTLEKVASHADL